MKYKYYDYDKIKKLKNVNVSIGVGMNKFRTAMKLAKGEWVNAKYVQELLNVDIYTIMYVFQFKRAVEGDSNIDNIYVRIMPRGTEDEKK